MLFRSTQSSGGTGGDATKQAVGISWKVVTATGSQTFNGATGANTDWAAGYAIFNAGVTTTITPAAASLTLTGQTPTIINGADNVYPVFDGYQNLGNPGGSDYLAVAGGGSPATEARGQMLIRPASKWSRASEYVISNTLTTASSTLTSRIDSANGTISVVFGAGVTGREIGRAHV